jgi:ribosomal protein S6
MDPRACDSLAESYDRVWPPPPHSPIGFCVFGLLNRNEFENGYTDCDSIKKPHTQRRPHFLPARAPLFPLLTRREGPGPFAMPHYEIMCVASAEVGHNKMLDLLKKMHGRVTATGGVVRGIEHLGIRPLAYKMRSHRKWHFTGRYLRLFLQVSPDALKDVKTQLSQSEEVVRFLTLKRPLAPSRPPLPLRWRSVVARPIDSGNETGAAPIIVP